MVAPKNPSMAVNLTKFLEGNPYLFAMLRSMKGTTIREVADKTIVSLVPTTLTNEPVTLTRQQVDALCAAACLGLEFCDCIQILT